MAHLRYGKICGGGVSGIKRTPADTAFSLCVRARANFRCQRCGTPHERSSTGLHASHHHRRGQWAVRFDPLNSEALCYGCHSHYGGTTERLNECLTEAQQALLRERKEDIGLAKMYRKTQGKGAIAKHFRDEFKRIMERREQGDQGYIDFEPFY